MRWIPTNYIQGEGKGMYKKRTTRAQHVHIVIIIKPIPFLTSALSLQKLPKVGYPGADRDD